MRRSMKVLFAVPIAAGAGFVIGMRRKSPALQDRIRHFSRDVMTPRVIDKAGTATSGNGVVHHRGRRSGEEYATPVTPIRIENGFVITLPYTARADWARNVLAAGEAWIEHRGTRYRVVDPEVVTYADVAPLLGAPEKAAAKLFDLQEYLRVRIAD